MSALGRTGVAMATGTLASRGTGFLRTVVLAAALGSYIGDPYNVANTLPNIIYDLLLGGVLSSVVVPLLVAAAERDGDGGEAYAQRLVTLVVALLSVVAVVGVFAAPYVIDVYSSGLPRPDHDLATTFARFFLPQVLFYGAGAVFTAILNTRDSFVVPMWAPVLNNVVVIAAAGLFLGMTTGHPHAGDLSSAQTFVLAIGTTAGIVLQTVALLPALRRVGFRLRPRWDLRGAGLRSAGSFAAWMLVYVAVNQAAYVVIVNLATSAGASRGDPGFGYSPYAYAFVIFSLPYAVVAVSVITALFPRMSRSATGGRRGEVANTLGSGLTLAAVLLLPSTVLLVALGPLIGTVLFAHGNTSLGDARLTGATLAGFAVGLVPFSAFQLQLRAFLAMRDARTPALVNLAITLLNLAADGVLYLALAPRQRVVGLAVGFSLSYVVGTAVLARSLRRRLGPVNEHRIGRTHVRLGAAALVAAVPTYVSARVLTAGLGLGVEASFVAVVVGSLLGGATYIGIARRLRVREVGEISGLLLSRFRRAG